MGPAIGTMRLASTGLGHRLWAEVNNQKGAGKLETGVSFQRPRRTSLAGCETLQRRLFNRLMAE
jgi:hypothetical protein